MINKFSSINIFFCFFVLFSQAVFSQQNCSVLFFKTNDISDYKSIGVNLSELPSEIANELKKYPAFLISPNAPKYEDIRSAQFTRVADKIGSYNDMDSFRNINTFRTVLSLFKSITSEAEYYFVGNGFYTSYLIAKTLFEGTPMEKNIKFIAFSRPLAELAYRNTETASNYFESLGVGKYPNKKIIVIDSLLSDDRPNGHSAIRTSIAIRKFLVSKGWIYRNAIDAIVTIGIIEGTQGPQSYRTAEIKTYLDVLSEINEDNFQTATFPYFDPSIKISESPFFQSYSKRGDGFYYWNGKYNQFDQQGFPEGTSNYRNMLSTYSLTELNNLLSERIRKANTFLDIIEIGLSYREELSQEIHEIINQHKIEF